VRFNKPFAAKGEVENWLFQLQEIMRDSLQKLMKKGKQDFEVKERSQWVLEHPAQIVSTVSHIMWCSYTEFSINNISESQSSMYDWATVNYTQLEQLTKLVTGELSAIQHRTIVALITQDVHARDIIDQLYEEEISQLSNFLWQKQLRYYWDDEIDSVLTRQVNCSIKYGFEYMGVATRLVITPLTDRCWLTITGALKIK